jgi:hypothetical protein
VRLSWIFLSKRKLCHDETFNNCCIDEVSSRGFLWRFCTAASPIDAVRNHYLRLGFGPGERHTA